MLLSLCEVYIYWQEKSVTYKRCNSSNYESRPFPLDLTTQDQVLQWLVNYYNTVPAYAPASLTYMTKTYTPSGAGVGAAGWTPFQQKVADLLAAGVPLDQAIQQAMAFVAGGGEKKSDNTGLLLIGAGILALILMGGKK